MKVLEEFKVPGPEIELNIYDEEIVDDHKRISWELYLIDAVDGCWGIKGFRKIIRSIFYLTPTWVMLFDQITDFILFSHLFSI